MKELLTDLMNQLCFYPLAMTATTLLAALAPESRPSFALWILGALPVFFLFYVRKRCKHLPVLLLLHGVVLVLFYVFPAANGVNRGVRLLVGAGFVIYSLWLRFRTEDFAAEPLPLPLAAGISLLCLFLQHYQENTAWDLYYRMSLILVFLLYAVILFLQSYEDFLTVNRLSTGKIPFQEILRSGLRSTTAFVLLSGVLLFAVSQFAWLKPFLQLLRSGLAAVLRFLFGLLPKDSTDPDVVIEQTVGGGDMPPMEAEDPFILWVILEYVAMIALLIACVFLLYRGIRKLVSFLRDRMQFSLPETASEKQESMDKREKLELSGDKNDSRQDKKRFSFLFPDARQKIRRIYLKKISNGGLAKERLPFYTARDAEKSLSAEGMAAIYEKARYSEAPCTEEDVRQMKKFV